jgi:hypothetical protein
MREIIWRLTGTSRIPLLVEKEKEGTARRLVPAGEFLDGGKGTDEGAGPFPIRLPSFYLAIHPVMNHSTRRLLMRQGIGRRTRQSLALGVEAPRFLRRKETTHSSALIGKMRDAIRTGPRCSNRASKTTSVTGPFSSTGSLALTD